MIFFCIFHYAERLTGCDFLLHKVPILEESARENQEFEFEELMDYLHNIELDQENALQDLQDQETLAAEEAEQQAHHDYLDQEEQERLDAEEAEQQAHQDCNVVGPAGAGET